MLHQISQGRFQAQQLVNLPVDLRHVNLADLPDIRAIRLCILRKSQQRLRLLQGEAQIAAAPDHSQPCNSAIIIVTPPAGGSRRRPDDALPFVVTDGLNSDPALAGCLPYARHTDFPCTCSRYRNQIVQTDVRNKGNDGVMTSAKREADGGASALSFLGLLSGSAAFLAAACCVLPFVFVAVGLGGAWLSFLDYGLAYRTEIQFLAVLAVSAAWLVYFWRGRPARTGKWLLIATLLLVGSWLVWEFQGEIRTWLLEIRRQG